MHKEIELVCSLIAIVNIITAIILYSKECKEGVTLSTGARRKAIMSCITMSILFSGISFCLIILGLLKFKHK